MVNIAAIKQHIRAVKAEKEKLRAKIADEFPIGGEVHWDKYGHRQYGTVLAHGGIGRTGGLRVQNERTGKSYWIDMYDVLGYVE